MKLTLKQTRDCLIKTKILNSFPSLAPQEATIPHDFSDKPSQENIHQIYVAIEGTGFDGHQNLKTVLKNPKACAIAEKIPEDLSPSQKNHLLIVESSRLAFGHLVAEAHGNPQNSLHSTAITGTNGKTTSANILFSIFQNDNQVTGMLGTIGWNWVDAKGESFEIPSTHTTPDPQTLMQMYQRFNNRGVNSVVLAILFSPWF